MSHPLDCVLNLSPECLDLSVRAKRAGVLRTKAKTLGDLVCWELDVLCYFPGLGETGAKSIKVELATWGLRFGMSREIALTREGWVFLGESEVPGIADERTVTVARTYREPKYFVGIESDWARFFSYPQDDGDDPRAIEASREHKRLFEAFQGKTIREYRDLSGRIREQYQ